MSNDFTTARANLVLTHVFFGALALRLKPIEDTSIETACTDGAHIRYNPTWFSSLSLQERIGIIAHEVMHPALLHHTRMGARDPKRWNVAADFAINDILLSGRITLPKCALHDTKYTGMAAEEIYALLPEDFCEGKGDDPGGCGGFELPTSADGKTPTNSELTATETEWKVALAQAAQVAKQHGCLPGGLERIIEATLKPATNWRQELNQFCNTPIPADVSWKRPNRRFVYNNLYLPSRDTKVTGTFVVAIDTSGSISSHEINVFGSEIKGIVDQLQPERIVVIYCDAQINRVDEFGPHDQIEFHAVGGGGTDFRPPFEWLNEHEIFPDAFIYLTDGYGLFPDENDIQYPVLWAINNCSVTPPFGVHLVIEEKS